MSECTHDCSTCSSNCSERTAPAFEKLHEESRVKKVIGIVSGKGGVGKSLVTGLSAVIANRCDKNVAILDADKEGFLRSDTSLIQTSGRAARNSCGEVIMYADKVTESMQRAIDETNRRREIQMEHNKKYGIIPQTIKKPIENNLLSLVESYRNFEDIVAEEMVELGIDKKDLPKLISKLEKDMHKAAKLLDFERAAEIRDQLKKLREMV